MTSWSWRPPWRAGCHGRARDEGRPIFGGRGHDRDGTASEGMYQSLSPSASPADHEPRRNRVPSLVRRLRRGKHGRATADTLTGPQRMFAAGSANPSAWRRIASPAYWTGSASGPDAPAVASPAPVAAPICDTLRGCYLLCVDARHFQRFEEAGPEPRSFHRRHRRPPAREFRRRPPGAHNSESSGSTWAASKRRHRGCRGPCLAMGRLSPGRPPDPPGKQDSPRRSPPH